MLLKKVAKAVIIGCRRPGLQVVRPAAEYWEQNKHLLIRSARAVKILQIQPNRKKATDDDAAAHDRAVAVLQSMKRGVFMMTQELGAPKPYFNSPLNWMGCSAMKMRGIANNRVSFFKVGGFGLNDVKAVLLGAILSRHQYSTFSSNDNVNNGQCNDNQNEKKESSEMADQASGTNTTSLIAGQTPNLKEQTIEAYTSAHHNLLVENLEIGVFINKNIDSGEMILFVMVLDSDDLDTINTDYQECSSEEFVDRTSLVILESTDEIVLLSSKFDGDEKPEVDSLLIKDIQGFMGMTDGEMAEGPANQIELEITSFLDEEYNRTLKSPSNELKSYRTAAEAYEVIDVNEATEPMQLAESNTITAPDVQPDEQSARVTAESENNVGFQAVEQAFAATNSEPSYSHLFECVNGRPYIDWESQPNREKTSNFGREFNASLQKSFSVINQIKTMIDKDLSVKIMTEEAEELVDMTEQPPPQPDVIESQEPIEYLAMQKSLNNILDFMQIIKSKFENNVMQAMAQKIDINNSLGEIKDLTDNLKECIDEAYALSQDQMAFNSKALGKSIHNATGILQELCEKVSLNHLEHEAVEQSHPQMPCSEEEMVEHSKKTEKPCLERDVVQSTAEVESSQEATAIASVPESQQLSYERSLVENMQILNEQTNQFLESQAAKEAGLSESLLVEAQQPEVKTETPQQVSSMALSTTEADVETPSIEKETVKIQQSEISPQIVSTTSRLPREVVVEKFLVQKIKIVKKQTEDREKQTGMSKLPKELVAEKPLVKREVSHEQTEFPQQVVSITSRFHEGVAERPLVRRENAAEMPKQVVGISRLPKEVVVEKLLVEKREDERDNKAERPKQEVKDVGVQMEVCEKQTEVPYHIVSSTRLPRKEEEQCNDQSAQKEGQAQLSTTIPAFKHSVVDHKKDEDIETKISKSVKVSPTRPNATQLDDDAEFLKALEALRVSTALKVESLKASQKQEDELKATQVTNVAMSKLEEALQSSKASLLKKYVSVVDPEAAKEVIPDQTQVSDQTAIVEESDELENEMANDKTEESALKFNNQLQKCQDLMDIISANTKLFNAASAEEASSDANVKAKEIVVNPPATTDHKDVKSIPVSNVKPSTQESIPAIVKEKGAKKDLAESCAQARKEDNFENPESTLNSFKEICLKIKKDFKTSQNVIDLNKCVRWLKTESCAEQAMQEHSLPILTSSHPAQSINEPQTPTAAFSTTGSQLVELRTPQPAPESKVFFGSNTSETEILLEKVKLLKAKWSENKAREDAAKTRVQTEPGKVSPEFPLKIKVREKKFPLTVVDSEPAPCNKPNREPTVVQTLPKQEPIKSEPNEKILKDTLAKLPSNVGTIVPPAKTGSRLRKVTEAAKEVLITNKIAKKPENVKASGDIEAEIKIVPEKNRSTQLPKLIGTKNIKEFLSKMIPKDTPVEDQQPAQAKAAQTLPSASARPESRPESKPALQAESKLQLRAQSKPELKDESKPGLKGESKPDSVEDVHNIAQSPTVAGNKSPEVQAAQQVNSERQTLDTHIVSKSQASAPREEVQIPPENTLLLKPKMAFKGRFAAAAKQNASASYEESLSGSGEKSKEMSGKGVIGERSDGKPRSLVHGTKVQKLNDRAEQADKKVVPQSAVQGLVQSKNIGGNSGDKNPISSRYKELLNKARNWDGLSTDSHRASQEIYRGPKDADPSNVLLAKVKSRCLERSNAVHQPALDRMQNERDVASGEEKIAKRETVLGRLRPMFVKQEPTPRPLAPRADTSSEKLPQSPLAKLSKTQNEYNRSHAMQAKPAPSLDMHEEVNWFQKMKNLTKKALSQPEECSETPNAATSSAKSEARSSASHIKHDESLLPEKMVNTFTKLPFRLPVKKPKLVDLVKESAKNQQSLEADDKKNKSSIDSANSIEPQALSSEHNTKRDKKEQEPIEELHETATKHKGNITAITFLPNKNKTTTSLVEEKEKVAAEAAAGSAKIAEAPESRKAEDSLAKASKPEENVTERASGIIVEDEKKKNETMSSETFNNLKKLLSQNISDGSKWPGCPDSYVPSTRSQGYSSVDLNRQRIVLDLKKIPPHEKPPRANMGTKSKPQKENSLKMWKSDPRSWVGNKKMITDESACVKFKKQFINAPLEKQNNQHSIKSYFVYPPNKQIKTNRDEVKHTKDSADQNNLMDKLTRHLRPEKKKLNLKELLSRSPSTSYLNISNVELPRGTPQAVTEKPREKSTSNMDQKRSTVNNFAARYNFKPEKKKLDLTNLLKQSIATKSHDDDDQSSSKPQSTNNKFLNNKFLNNKKRK